MSCIEAIGAHTLQGNAIDERYKEVSTKLLVDAEVDAILEQE